MFFRLITKNMEILFIYLFEVMHEHKYEYSQAI
jgi:hypothetical protein